MRLVRELGTFPFARGARPIETLAAARLARALGTTRQTIEARLVRLEIEGVVAGYQLWPNLRHLGVQWEIHHWRVEDPDRRADAFRHLAIGDGVAAVYSFLGPDLCVDLYWRDEHERGRLVGQVAAAVGEGAELTLYRREMPPIGGSLSALDWRIVAALRHDPRRSPEDVGRDIGVSGRTVKRRLAKMADEGGFDVTARVALERARRSIPFALLIHFMADGGRRTASELMRLFDDRCLAAWVPPSPGLGHWDMSLCAASPAEVEEMRQRASQVPGVARVELLLYTGARVDETWLDRMVRARAEAS